MAQRQNKNREKYFKAIDFIFYHEKQIRDAVKEARTSGSRDATISLFPVASANNFSDPTATKAIKNLIPLKFVKLPDGTIIKYPEKWLEVIEKTYSYCKKQNDCRFEVARRRYNNEDYRKTCIDLNISNTTRRRLLELMQIYAALQAVQAGLIRV